MWLRRTKRSRPVAERQQLLAFEGRSERRVRAFKATVIAATTLALAAIWGSNPTGRYLVRAAMVRARWLVLGQVGLAPPRAEFEADRNRRRELGVVNARAALAQVIVEGGPRVEKFLKAARMDPDTAVIRNGNFDASLVLSSAVFEPDDTGRSYRLKPKTRSIWLIGISLRGVAGLFEVPCTDEARDTAAPLGGWIVPESLQTTNSWGCRGPEPDLNAPLRGLVLGDSVMQGLLVGDDQTPSMCLQRALGEKSGAPVSVLNTGVLGYSIEQYYYTLTAFAGRFRPHFVLVSICGNDFGQWTDRANWDEAGYWLERIAQYCRSHDYTFLFVPWPGEDALLGTRDESLYPGLVSHVTKFAGTHYFYPVEAFTDEDLRLRIEADRRGRPVANSRLYNRHLMGDNHLSPLGCAFWARVVADRLWLIRERQALTSPARPAASASPNAQGRSAPRAAE